jgi:putative serine protease PepD
LEKYEERPAGARAGIGMVLVVSVVTALLAGALGGTLGYIFAGGGSSLGTPLGGDPQLAQRAPDSVAGLAKKVLPSVVTVRIRAGGGASLGSGFIASDDGYVITNQHVVAGGSGGAFVTFNDGNVVEAKVVGTDPESDVAVLKVDQKGLPAAEFGDSDAVQVGDPVIAIGAPLGLSSTVTLGIVSAVDRPIQTNNNGGSPRYYAAIQTDAAVNQGNSGGPLFDAAGRVIGINSVIGSLSQDRENAGNVGLAFAIPINHAKRVAQDIIATGKARRTVIGATFDNTYRNVAGGARIQSVDQNGPAAAAGLRAGDVILRIGGRSIEEAADVVALVRKYAPGANVAVDYQRNGSKAQATVTLVADAK